MTERQVSPPVLKAEHVSRHFGAVLALRDASLTLSRGEIVALMGANGAGKSTLVKILTGVLRPGGGTITLNGRPARIPSPAGARRAGLVPVYQEPSLIRDLSIGDNLRLGQTPVAAFRTWVEALGIPGLRLDAMIRDLPLATLRILDLARALAAEPEVLMLDEMTAALPTDLVTRVLDVIRAEAGRGRSILYISHRFAEIARVCDRATVLRDGVTVGDVPITPGVEERVVELMLGAPAGGAGQRLSPATPARAGMKPRLAAQNLTAGSRLSGLSFDLFPGEVLGLVALEGQGQDELFDILAGNRRARSGKLEVGGSPVHFRHPGDAIAAGLALVPGDRAEALLMPRPVRENIALPAFARPRNWGAIPMRAESARVGGAISRLQIDTRAQGEVRRLSGGNQQKVTIARWIAEDKQTLLLFDPTRGIDIRTKRQIYALMRDLAGQGTAILFYTSELAEVREACDRVLVMFGGRVVDEAPAGEADEAWLMRAVHGLTGQEGLAS